MKNNFFSAVQGKFKAEFHGRYLGHILEQIAALRPEVIAPLLKKAPLVQRWPVKSVQDVTTEVSYLSDKSRREDEAEEKDGRRADLAIELDNGERIHRMGQKTRSRKRRSSRRMPDGLSNRAD